MGIRMGENCCPQQEGCVAESVCTALRQAKNIELNKTLCRIAEGFGNDSFFIDKPAVCQHSEVSLPLRVNWCGTWTDTPPYCLDHAGAVLNCAIAIGGKLPVTAKAFATQSKALVFEYSDSHQRTEIISNEQLLDFGNPVKPFSLMKAAVTAAGVNIQLIEKHHGIRICAGVHGIPMGSGLGTSSILILAIIKALHDLFGIETDNQELIRRVLLAEQLMNTGGGWQDQAGGIMPGIKLACSQPGNRQAVEIKRLCCPPAFVKFLDDRFCLVYTAQRRLGREILSDIVSAYTDGSSDALKTFELMRASAFEMSDAAQSGDCERFISLMNENVERIASFRTDYTNSVTDGILRACEGLICAYMPCGAGGGGFLQMILSDGITKDELNLRLKQSFPDSGIAVWDMQLYR